MDIARVPISAKRRNVKQARGWRPLCRFKAVGRCYVLVAKAQDRHRGDHGLVCPPKVYGPERRRVCEKIWLLADIKGKNSHDLAGSAEHAARYPALTHDQMAVSAAVEFVILSSIQEV